MDSLIDSVPSRDWAKLSNDPLYCVLEKLTLLSDYIRFGAVCKSWSLFALQQKQKRKESIQQEPPLLLIPVTDNGSVYYDHSSDPWFKQRYSTEEADKTTAMKSNPVPPYLKRAGFKPTKPEDFGDGRAFLEIHIVQYPLDMGREKDWKPGIKTMPVTVDKQGNVRYDAIVRQNENSKKIVYSQHKDLIPKVVKDDQNEEDMDLDEKQKEIEETTQNTKAALEKIVNVRLSAAQPKNVPTQSSGSKFIKYKPSQQSTAFNLGANERIIRMVETPVDPLEPPKFKHKRVPKASGSPPVPVMHSPPRPVTVKDQQAWRIPPCISNWKNPNCYAIPLDKHLSADEEIQINYDFAKLAEALYVSEKKASEGVATRSKVQKEMMMKEKEKKEMELRKLARKARSERNGTAPPAAVPMHSDRGEDGMVMDFERVRDVSREKETKGDREERLQREKIREERRRKRERERRLEAKDATMGKKSKISRERRLEAKDAAFVGTSERSGSRDVLVEFDKEPDPFGLDKFITDVKKGKKAIDKIGRSGTLKATAGSMRDGYETSSRNQIAFERGS